MKKTEVWFTHAMLLHWAERENHQPALAGAQILPRATWRMIATSWLSQVHHMNYTHAHRLLQATSMPHVFFCLLRVLYMASDVA